MSTPKPLLLTMGDAAGVGPDLIAMLFRDRTALAELSGGSVGEAFRMTNLEGLQL